MKKLFLLLLILGITTISFHSLKAQTAKCGFDTFTQWSGLLGSYFEGQAVNNKGTVVLKSFEGLSVYKLGAWTQIPWPQVPHGQALAVDENDVIWFGTPMGELKKFVDTNNITTYDTTDGLPAQMISTLKFAPDGKLWMGFFGGGIASFDGTNFSFYDTTDGMSDMYPEDFAFKKNGDMVIVYRNPNVDIFNGTTFTSLPATPANANELMKVDVDNKGNVYAIAFNMTTYENFLLIYDGTSWTAPSLNLPPEPYVYDIMVDWNNDVYLATNYGLYKMSGAQYSIYNQSTGLLEDFCNSIAFDSKGNVWVFSQTGVTKFTQSAAVTGTSYAGTFADTSAIVKLFMFTEGVKKLTMQDSVKVSGTQPMYEFNSLPLGDYTIYSIPGSWTNAYIPTWYGNVELWQSAVVLKMHFCGNVKDSADIHLVEKIVLPPGKGYISGYVKSTDGTRAGSSPIKDVDVTLKKVPGGAFLNTKTNDQGKFEFSDVPNGTFGIWVDLPGLVQDTVRLVTITDDDTLYTNEDYGVDSNGIHTNDFTSIRKLYKLTGIKVSPNPTYGFVQLDFANDGLTNIFVINSSGQVINKYVVKEKGETRLMLDLGNLPKGMYFLKFQAEDLNKTVKIQLR